MIDLRPAGRIPFAVKLAEIQSSDRVLNVGCFNGSMERFFLVGRCLEYVGIDPNDEAIQFANEQKRNLQSKGVFLKGLSESLPFADHSFDKVFCLDTLEHTENDAKSLQEIHRVLKPDGFLILSVPHDFLN